MYQHLNHHVPREPAESQRSLSIFGQPFRPGKMPRAVALSLSFDRPDIRILPRARRVTELIDVWSAISPWQNAQGSGALARAQGCGRNEVVQIGFVSNDPLAVTL